MKIKHVYIASGWFTARQREILEFIEKTLDTLPDIVMYSPRRETQFESGTKLSRELCKDIFDNNVEAIKDSDFVIASTQGRDLGTLIEMGIAYTLKKPIVAVYFSEEPFNLMAEETTISVARNKDQLLQILGIISSLGLKSKKAKIELDKFRYQGKIE